MKRNTGYTSKMLLRALLAVLEGKNAVIIVDTDSHGETLIRKAINMLGTLGLAPDNSDRSHFKFIRGSMQVLPNDGLARKILKGIKHLDVFYDNSVRK